MQQNANTTKPNSISLAPDYPAIKGKIVGAGIRLGDLARAAGITPSCLTLYIQGKLRDPRRQRDIWVAFRAMSQLQITAADFWGGLLSKRIAG